ncbi:phosphopantothenoylcysteine decarboxylase [Diplocarpon rosae]|nr:phosphopantothenoylcysteine decarboxylase [Diplocarpon rosae]
MLDVVNDQHNHSESAIPEPPFLASAHFSDNKKHLLLAASGSHPITGRQIGVLEEEWGVEGGGEGGGWFEVLKPMEKELVCGDVGDGAMMDWKDIVKVVEERLGL